MSKNQINLKEYSTLLLTLEERFHKNMQRHSSIKWENVQAKLENTPDKLDALFAMEESGGEPDIVAFNNLDDSYIFFDCSAESPKGRRSLCYDRSALDARKEHKPANSSIDLANEMGISILNEDEYRFLQTLGKFDLKTSSWVATPENIRKLGGAVFCDRRYETVFLYHNGAESYYASRGFRAKLIV